MLNKTLLRLFLFATLLAAAAFGSGCDKLKDEYWSKVKLGNDLYSQAKYEDSMKAYHDARLLKPESPLLDHNTGNVFYKEKNYDKAIETWNKAVNSSDREIAGKAHYNIGNAYYRQEKLEEAILEYKKALEIDPDDVEAKYNLELARIKLKEKLKGQQKDQQQNQQQEQQNKDCPNPKQGEGQGQQGDKDKQTEEQKQKMEAAKLKENPDQNEKKKEEEKQAGDKKDEEEKKKEEQQKAGGKNQEQDEKKNGEPDDKKDEDITEEQALRILRALDSREKDDKKKNTIPIPSTGMHPEKDW